MPIILTGTDNFSGAGISFIAMPMSWPGMSVWAAAMPIFPQIKTATNKIAVARCWRFSFRSKSFRNILVLQFAATFAHRRSSCRCAVASLSRCGRGCSHGRGEAGAKIKEDDGGKEVLVTKRRGELPFENPPLGIRFFEDLVRRPSHNYS